MYIYYVLLLRALMEQHVELLYVCIYVRAHMYICVSVYVYIWMCLYVPCVVVENLDVMTSRVFCVCRCKNCINVYNCIHLYTRNINKHLYIYIGIRIYICI